MRSSTSTTAAPTAPGHSSSNSPAPPAALAEATGDAGELLDADLQDPPELRLVDTFPMHHVNLRLMDERDLHSTERLSADLFYEADRLTRRMNEPEIERRSASVSAQWIERMRFFLSVDPEGCWVADDGEDIVGFAISQNRGAFWYLATYGVSTGRQGQGIGRRLMDAALTHAAGRQGMFSSSVHPGATRRYRLAGFTLMPQMRMVGTVDRSRLPAVTGLREGTENDIAWMDLLDERLRGAGHGPDHTYMTTRLRLVVTVSPDDPGYVYIDDRGRAALLAADRPETAQRLLWEALAAAQPDTLVNCITADNEWAVDVGLRARLDIGQEGYLAVRGMRDPAPYLASGHFL